jgi:hypothetical protein
VTEEEREYRQARFEEIVADPWVRSRVLDHLSFLSDDDEPGVAPADIEAARSYLKQCMSNMSLNELSQKDRNDLAALWARGSLGAARYRAQGRLAARPRRARSE